MAELQAAARRTHRAACVLSALLLWATLPIAQEPAEPDRARELGITERAETRLSQLDIAVFGPPETIAALTAEDFKIKVNFTTIREFTLDRICPDLPVAPDPPIAEGASPGILPRYPFSFLIYLDQPHLTIRGRSNALRIARELITELVRDGNQAMIASNAERLDIIRHLTSDRDDLLLALDELEQNRRHWDVYADTEARRVGDVVSELNDGDLFAAIALARIYQREERWRADKNLRRLQQTLGRLVDTDPPKAVLYFADTMRSNAGEHYLSFFGQQLANSRAALSGIRADSASAALAFDRVINEASAQGIRIYTVQPEGLVTGDDIVVSSPTAMSMTGVASQSSRVRSEHARKSLQDMSMETGGYAFLNTLRGTEIAERIGADSDCTFRVSFDPSKFSEDLPMRVIVRVRRPGIDFRVRGRMIFQSEKARRTARLSRAFSTPGAVAEPFSVQTNLVPLAYRKGKYSALLQLSVPATPLQAATWDLGASVIADDHVSREASGRVSVNGPGVPIVFESEMSFKPGSYEIVAVAHEAASGMIASTRITVDWPDPNRDGASMGPIALLQPAAAAFNRSGNTRRRGSLAVAPQDQVSSELPAALVGLVCRGRRASGSMRVERDLIGESVVALPEMQLDLSEERCVQVRDLLPAKSLAPGLYRYDVRVIRKGEIVHRGVREFVVVAPRS